MGNERNTAAGTILKLVGCFVLSLYLITILYGYWETSEEKKKIKRQQVLAYQNDPVGHLKTDLLICELEKKDYSKKLSSCEGLAMDSSPPSNLSVDGKIEHRGKQYLLSEPGYYCKVDPIKYGLTKQDTTNVPCEWKEAPLPEGWWEEKYNALNERFFSKPKKCSKEKSEYDRAIRCVSKKKKDIERVKRSLASRKLEEHGGITGEE